MFLIFFSFLDTERFFWPNLAKKVAGLSKLDSRFQWKLSGESFLQNLQSVVFLNIEQKMFGWLSKKKSAGLSTSPWEQFEENSFEKFLHLLWTFFRIISGNWAGKLWPPCQNCILHIYKIILKKKFFWKTNEVFHHFETVSRKFLASCPVFWRGC